MPRAADAYLNGGLPMSNNPLDRIGFQANKLPIDPLQILAQWTQFFQEYGLPILENLIGVPLTVLKDLYDQFQNIIDTVINAISGGAGVGQTLEQLQGVFAKLSQDVTAALNSAAQAADFASKAFNAVIQIVSQGVAPVYDFWGDILNGFMFWFLGLFGNTQSTMQTSTSNNGQINAIWAHLNTSSTGIRYLFDPTVALNANYPGTTNPSWTPPSGYSLPTVVAGTDYIGDSSVHIGVFTGYTLTSDKVHVETTLKFASTTGTAKFFLCGHGTTTLTQHVVVEIDLQSYGNTLALCTYTGPNGAGRNQRVIVDGATFGRLKADDVIACEYDNANHFQMFLNGTPVGAAWTATGVTHGAGYRECGIYDGGNGFGGNGPGLGVFVAYDF